MMLLGPPLLLLLYPDPGGEAGALFPCATYRPVKEMQETERTARFPVGS
jgi:hypothetical protein